VPVRDAVRRDIEQATQALAFVDKLSTALDGQRRLFIDFPRVMEEMRSGALERVAGALSHLYEGGQGVLDLTRFLRDLPLALAHLAAAEAQARRNAPRPLGAARTATAGAAQAGGEAQPSATEGAQPQSAEAAQSAPAGSAQASEQEPSSDGAASTDAAASAHATSSEASSGAAAEGASPPSAGPVATDAAATAGAPAAEQVNASSASSQGAAGADAPDASRPPPAAAPQGAAEGAAEGASPVSPRLELRAKLLAAAPQLARAAQTYRRNAATVRRATAPRRSPGPWRSDREVLEQGRRAIEFARQIYDAYAEAWADTPLQRNADEATSAETDRFLAWTQLSRYVEVARTQPAAPASAGQSQPPPVQQGAAPHGGAEEAAGGSSSTAGSEQPAHPAASEPAAS
jgi:hypothetical protein